MRRIILLFTVVAMMAVLLSISAGPASARVIFTGDDHHKFNDRDGFVIFNDDDDDFDFFGNRGFDFDDGEVSLDLGDVENDSGDVELDNSFDISGNNNNACLGQTQFGNSGNFTNQQGAFEFGGGVDDFDRNHRGDRDGFVIVSDDDDDDFFVRDRNRDFFDFGDRNNNI